MHLKLDENSMNAADNGTSLQDRRNRKRTAKSH